jgi:hypothetical protein
MHMNPHFRHLVASAILLGLSSALIAQGPPGRDRDNPPPGHGGTPPGQERKQDRGDRGVPPGQARKYGDEGHLPPGQAKRYFHDRDRGHFYAHYRRDVDRWRGRRRPVFAPGEYIAREYVMQPVPRSVWINVVAPPPPGYLYGYYGGYVVAYNPETRIIADVLDLVAAASSR